MSTALNNNSIRSTVPGTVAISDAERLALATGAAAYRWEDLTKAPVSPSLPLIQDVMEMEPKISGLH
jgi:hypothetical protein